nr:MAG TPA: hypothetical protein [Caudoviricetes sp.]
MSASTVNIKRDEISLEVCGVEQAGFFNPFVPEVPLDTWGIHLKVETEKALIHFHLLPSEAKYFAKCLRKAAKEAKRLRKEENE